MIILERKKKRGSRYKEFKAKLIGMQKLGRKRKNESTERRSMVETPFKPNEMRFCR